MSTSPKNQDGLLHTAKPRPPRRPQQGELLWTLRKGTDRQTAELRTSPTGVELQLLRNGAWYFGRRHETRELALLEAAVVRQDLERDGWTAKP